VSLVTTDVEQCTTTHLGLGSIVVGEVTLKGERGGDGEKISEIPAPDDLGHPLHPWLPPGPHSLDEQALMSRSCGLHRAHFIRIESEWLLAQHVLSGLEGSDHPFFVLNVCEADVHRIDVWIVDQGAIRVVNDDWFQL
jgi:hypothetical protein